MPKIIEYNTATRTTVKGIQPRNLMIDCAKGIGILLIVLMHLKPFNIAYPDATNILFSIVVSFFFFLSGVTFSLGDGNLLRIAKQRADALLKPCLVVLLTLSLTRVAGGRASLEEALLNLTYLSGFSLPWPPLWFLPHLWIVSLFSGALLIYLGPVLRAKRARLLLLAGMLALGYGILKMFSSVLKNASCEKIVSFQGALLECGLPFSIDLLLISSAFFISGYFLAARVKSLSSTIPLFFATSLILATASVFLKDRIDMNARLYPYIALTPLVAFLGTYMILQLAYYCSTVKYISKLLSLCGNASLFILIFHTPVLSWLLFHLPLWIRSPMLVGALSFTLPIIASLGVYYVVQRSKALSYLMLPLRKSRTPRVQAVANT